MCGLVPPAQRFRVLAAGGVQQLRQCDLLNPARALIHRRNDQPSALLSAVRSSHAYNEYIAAQAAHARRTGATTAAPQTSLSLRGWSAASTREWVTTCTGIMGALIGPQQRDTGGVDRVLAMEDGPTRRAAAAWRSGAWHVGWRCQCGGEFNRGHFACLNASTEIFSDGGPLGGDVTLLDHRCAQWQLQVNGLRPDVVVNAMDFALGHEEPRWHEVAVQALQTWATMLEPPDQHAVVRDASLDELGLVGSMV